MSSKDKRETITVKLTPGKDDDLINWWNRLPKGTNLPGENTRQNILKTMLRTALDLPIPPADADALDRLTAEFAAALDEERERRAALEQELQRQKTITANLPALVKQIASSSTPAALDDARVTELEQRIDSIMTWANGVHALLQNGAVAAASSSTVADEPAPVVEDGLTDAEQQQRARKLKKAQW